MQKNKALILVMAGGTGGHVFPALACARALREEHAEVRWLGTRRGLESRIIPPTGIPLHYLSIAGLRGKNKWTLLLAPFRLLWALSQALYLIWRLKPAAVLGMGGFVTGPGGLAAWLLRVPLLIHEQNAIPGLTNRLLSRLAKRVMQAFPNTFPAAVQALTTGNPLRPEITALADKGVTEPRQPLHILVLGGSLGATALNDCVPRALSRVPHAVSVRHQSGNRHLDKTLAVYRECGVAGEVSEFIEDMGEAYAWADLIICRAGALSVSEIAQAGKAAILVPYPYAVDDHQTVNAAFLVSAGAAVLMPQLLGKTDNARTNHLTPDNLARVISALCANPQRLRAMSEAARQCAQPEALKNITAYCREYL